MAAAAAADGPPGTGPASPMDSRFAFAAPDDPRTSLVPDLTKAEFDSLIESGMRVPLVSDLVTEDMLHKMSAKETYAKQFPLRPVLDISSRSTLWIGTWAAAENGEMLARNGIGATLCAAKLKNVQVPAGVYSLTRRNMTNLQDLVKPMETLIQSLWELDEHLEKEGSTMVHCNSGAHRSVFLCTAYLMAKTRMTYDEAITVMKGVRRLANLWSDVATFLKTNTEKLHEVFKGHRQLQPPLVLPPQQVEAVFMDALRKWEAENELPDWSPADDKEGTDKEPTAGKQQAKKEEPTAGKQQAKKEEPTAGKQQASASASGAAGSAQAGTKAKKEKQQATGGVTTGSAQGSTGSAQGSIGSSPADADTV